LFYIIRANFDFAEMSIPQRQIERYGRVVTAYNNLLRQFPETRFMSQATRMKETAQSEIERLQATLEITENN
jgi:outer membrane protein assembly factor BamD